MVVQLEKKASTHQKSIQPYVFSDEYIEKERKINKKNTPSVLMNWLRWNGLYIYAYGCSIAGVLCAMLSPLLNMCVVRSAPSYVGFRAEMDSPTCLR